MSSYRDNQVLVALKLIRATGLVELDDSEMSELTGLKKQELYATYRSLKSQGLIEYSHSSVRGKYSSWVALTKKGRQTAQEASQAFLSSNAVDDTKSKKQSP